jgi:hypothetical protein
VAYATEAEDNLIVTVLDDERCVGVVGLVEVVLPAHNGLL